MDMLPFINAHNSIPDWWELAFIAVPALIIFQQFRKRAGVVSGVIVGGAGVVSWCILWWALTFFGGLVGTMAQHYEEATAYEEQQRQTQEYNQQSEP